MKITISNFDGLKEEIRISEIREVVRYDGLFLSSLLRPPYKGVLFYRNKLLPVLGPLPRFWDANSSEDEKPWVLVLGDHARVIKGLPEFPEAAESGEYKTA